MAGIFGGHLFRPGMGQTDMQFSLDDPDVQMVNSGAGGKTGGGSAYIPPTGGKTGSSQAYIPPDASSYMPSSAIAPAAGANTMIYVVGGVAVVGLLAVMMMGGRGGRVQSNRGRRGRRSRRRGR